ncbi:MAG: heavy metal translocating P-type ATPase [Clostridiales bacterium]|nr:heavy metal translocating P-type ATPase [Clostridiales bacterium]
MTYHYRLQGLDCANCAMEINQAISALPQVSSAKVDFPSQKLTFTTTSPATLSTEAVKQIVHQYEPEVEVLFWEEHTAKDVEKIERESKKAFQKEWKIIAISLLLTVIALIVRPASPPVSTAFLLAAYVLCGFDIGKTAFQRIFRKKPLDETLLMTIATLGAWLLGEGVEAVAVMVFYRVGETLQEMAVHRSRGDIRALSSLISEQAHLVVGQRTKTIATNQIAIGDILEVRRGERIPVDGKIITGEGVLNTAALTGEALPQTFTVGDIILSGSTNQGPHFHMEATQTLQESTVTRILKMTQEEEARKAAPERFLAKFAYYYTPSVVLLAFFVFLLPPLFHLGTWQLWAYRALLLLVISCPCALVLSVPLSYVAGISKSAKEGILVKGGTVLEALSQIDTLALDKTGTLTKGEFAVTAFSPAVKSLEEDFLFATFLCENKAQHPLAQSIMASPQGVQWRNTHPDLPQSIDFYEEIPGKGVSLFYQGEQYFCGSSAFLVSQGVSLPLTTLPGQVFTAKGNQYLGSVSLADTLRPEAEHVLASLSSKGIQEIHVLTGDSINGTQVLEGIKTLSSVHAGLLPQDKASHIHSLQSQGRHVAFVGDGINDAPVLAAAQVGIAIGGIGSQAATQAADAVLAQGTLTALPKAFTIAKRTTRMVRINVVLALVVKLAVMVLGIMGLANMWMALFADVGVSLLCVLLASTIRVRKV